MDRPRYIVQAFDSAYPGDIQPWLNKRFGDGYRNPIAVGNERQVIIIMSLKEARDD